LFIPNGTKITFDRLEKLYQIGTICKKACWFVAFVSIFIDISFQESHLVRISYSLVDLFCGAGGLSLGLSASKCFEPVAAIECEISAADTYKKNFPNAEVLQTRIENVSGKQLLDIAKNKGFTKIDAICGGPPCRPFSRANKGSTQWKVVKTAKKIAYHPDWRHFLRLITQLSPKFVIAENVMGFRSNRDVFAPFVKKLQDLGYSVASPLLDASEFGVPQKRERIVIIAAKGNIPKELLIPKMKIPKKNSVKYAIHDLPPLTNTRTGAQKIIYEKFSRNSPKSKKTILKNHQTHSVHPVMQKRFQYIPQGYNLKQAWDAKKIPKKIACSSYFQGGRVRQYTLKAINQMHSNIYRRLSWSKPAPTLTNARKTVILHPSQNRILSVRECARIQSFPDNFVFCGSLSQQYQQVADSVPPLLAKEVGSRIVTMYTNHQKSRNTARR